MLAAAVVVAVVGVAGCSSGSTVAPTKLATIPGTPAPATTLPAPTPTPTPTSATASSACAGFVVRDIGGGLSVALPPTATMTTAGGTTDSVPVQAGMAVEFSLDGALVTIGRYVGTIATPEPDVDKRIDDGVIVFVKAAVPSLRACVLAGTGYDDARDRADATSTTPPNSTTTTLPATTTPVETGIVRPYVDPARCRPDHVATYGIDDGTLRLFAGPREAPIPIQIIGDPDDGPTKPFAVVERFFGPVTIAAPTVAQVYANGNGAAKWTLPDAGTAYLRSRGLSQSDLIDIIGRLSPRDHNAPVPGFDYLPNPDNHLQLVVERLNTHITGHSDVLTCYTLAGGLYYISTLVGDSLYVYGGVIDRSVPKQVGITDGTVIVISGQASPDAPTPADVVNADPAIWQTIPTSTLPAPSTTT
jgi:hypothetical protein